MTEEQKIKLAGRIRKVVRLAGMVGMDGVAVKLNSGLTYDEMHEAQRWALAFELAHKGGELYHLALEFKQRAPK